METMKFEYVLSKDLLHVDFGEEMPGTKEVPDKNLELERIYSEMGDNNLTGLKMRDFTKRKERYGEDLSMLGIDVDVEMEIMPHLKDPVKDDVIVFTLYRIDGRWQRVY